MKNNAANSFNSRRYFQGYLYPLAFSKCRIHHRVSAYETTQEEKIIFSAFIFPQIIASSSIPSLPSPDTVMQQMRDYALPASQQFLLACAAVVTIKFVMGLR